MIITPDGVRDRLGRREFMGLAVGAFVIAAVPLARRRSPAVIRRAVPVMGTVAQFAVVARDPWRAHEAIDAAVAELRWVERTMTRFTTTSDIGRANEGAARDAVSVAPATADVVAEGMRWASAMDGRYDPAAGAIVALWDIRSRQEPPPAHATAELAGRHFHHAVEIGTRRGSPVLRYHAAGPRLDLGSIAKGYGVDRAVHALRSRGVQSAVVVAGGDLYALGQAPDGEPWTVGIQSPTDPDGIEGTLRISDGAVATSGTYRQFFRHGGRTYHHLMDPSTAAPRITAMRSLSIIADSVMHADAATTALFGLTEAEIGSALSRHLPGARLARIL